MTNNIALHQNVIAAVAALVLSSACILGAVGPIEGSDTAQPVQLQTQYATTAVMTGQLA
ncbi:hypothetical protein [Parasphingopyxis marina]|uniref:Uncharacterized protein n=1 Tax=Parasphingopyxis marina TaxID=2761622 RepID=A0A842HZ27_9SPHN|nr:hypothetical protein [Parasphingopyxis marina]MBC2777683.1 hypothetical protein [Parasphingopyxis marina]